MQNVDVNATNDFGCTALYYAASRGQEGIVRLLLEKGAQVGTADQYEETALHLAATRGYLGVTRLLLDHGAQVDVANHKNETALHQAADCPASSSRSWSSGSDSAAVGSWRKL